MEPHPASNEHDEAYGLSPRDGTATLLADIAAVEAQGRALDALALVRAALRTEIDAALACRLVQLRHAAFRELLETRKSTSTFVPRPQARTELPIEPPPGVPWEALSAARLREQLQRHGCVLVRGMVPPPVLEELIEAIDRAFSAHDAFMEKRPHHAGWFDPVLNIAGGADTRAFVRAGDGVFAADSPLALHALIGTYAELGVERLVTDYFGERPAIAAEKTTLRHLRTTGEPEWHQDGRFLGTKIRSLNAWVALTDCGVDSPGLDIVPVYPDRILETGTGAARFDWTIDHGLIVREFGPAAIWTPRFLAGDALLFDHMLVHRTGCVPSMSRSRYALETWFFAPSAYPAGQTPLLV